MSYSDDYATTSTTNDAQDAIADSPVTTERVVDTQSGFLVVIKRLEARLALSVKRRIGTPPSSSILLTQDESLKLARILSDGQSEQPENGNGNGRKSSFARDIDNWINTLSSKPEAKTEPVSSAGELDAYNQLDQYESADSGLEPSPSSRWDKFMMDEPTPEARRAARKQRKSGKKITIPPGAKKLAMGLVATVVVVGIGGAVFSAFKPSEKNAPKPDVLAAAPLSDAKVDKFARSFVSNMLDFGPTTYRMSQIQAMSVMNPELLDNYWQETNFPLTKKQLSGLPQNQTVLITKVTQERLNETTKDVDIFAELVSADNKMSSPVHLKLKVAQTAENALQVIEQKDLTAGTHE
ncbi:MAG TPA: hypothetical protein PKZ32_15095 [Candidatus Melainabacteria bacterium]|nr:hypothetical protein [Candidatus Melainabacteria bacterium]